MKPPAAVPSGGRDNLVQTVEFGNSRELVDRFRRALDAEQDVLLRSTAETNTIEEFARSVADGMQRASPSLDCRYLYDERGSALFEEICAQPEYYLTGSEDEILARHGATLRELTGPVRLLELGSGNAMKTDHLLSAWLERADETSYVPVDVSESALRKAGATIAAGHDGVRFVGVNATYQEAFPLLRPASPVMMMLMGSTLGNLGDDEAERFWRNVSRALHAGDFFLLGIDLIKDHDLMEAAYNDAAGVTARFTLNLFERMNRELDSDIQVESLSHQAHYNEARERIETYVRFDEAQRIDIAPLGRSVYVEAGTQVLVEISRKYRVDRVAEDLRRHHLERVADFSDERGRFALLLLRRTAHGD